MVASISHALTPGTPVYGLLKLGAVGSVVALKVGLTQRDKRRAAQSAEPVAAAPAPAAAAAAHRAAHPRSKKKKRRRR